MEIDPDRIVVVISELLIAAYLESLPVRFVFLLAHSILVHFVRSFVKKGQPIFSDAFQSLVIRVGKSVPSFVIEVRKVVQVNVVNCHFSGYLEFL